MLKAYRRGDALALLVLVVLPALAHAPALLERRLLGPGDGVALHLPMRVAAWAQWRDLSVPLWNEALFLGTPLLAAYRGGVLHPLTILLSPFGSFDAFQALVLISLAATGIVTFFYLKRLGAASPGAFVGALSFAHGPYFVSNIEDTAALTAAPLIPLAMLAAESHMNRATGSRLAGLGGALALLAVSGSPEAVRAGVILVCGRLALGHTLSRSPRGPSVRKTALALLLGAGLSAPQWLPTLALLPDAGRQVTGLHAEAAAREGATGLAGLILRHVSHSPAFSLAIASLPLAASSLPVRVLLAGALLSFALQVGRGPLLAPGSMPLVAEFVLAVLGGLALDAQWRSRGLRDGRRLRAYFLVASIASVAAMALAAATLGPLPERLSSAVGLYAIALVAYFTLSHRESAIVAGAFLIPLAFSFAAQPWSRDVWQGAPTRAQLIHGTPARRAVDLALREIAERPRVLIWTREWPENAVDLAYAGYGAFTPRIQANGYDPLAPVARRRVVGEMGARGFFSQKAELPGRVALQQAGIDALLVRSPDLEGPLETPLLVVLGGSVWIPVRAALTSAIRVEASSDQAPWLSIRTASGRVVDVGRAAPQEAGSTVYEWRLPGRYLVDGVRIAVEGDRGGEAVGRAQGAGIPTGLHGLAVLAMLDDATPARPVSSLAIHLATEGFSEEAAAPTIRVFRVPRKRGPVETLPNDRFGEGRRAFRTGCLLAAAAGLAAARLSWRRRLPFASRSPNERK